ncbi:MAG: hypothetical protein IK122_03365, partial [Alphaproteobacteria bacterium]|nr:hypothetical protein [Alphaproteobacteria bacterium]
TIGAISGNEYTSYSGGAKCQCPASDYWTMYVNGGATIGNVLSNDNGDTMVCVRRNCASTSN